MRTSLLIKVILGITVAAGFSAAATAQDEVQKPSAVTQPQQKPGPKARRVWTNDDVVSVRTPADNYADGKAAQAAEVSASQASAPTQPVKPAQQVAPPALSNPKTVDDADKMIAWEKRDADAQAEYIERVKKQIEEASPEDKARLQNELEQRIKILADVRKEMQQLADQKKELQKKPPVGNNAGAADNNNVTVSQPPSR